MLELADLDHLRLAREDLLGEEVVGVGIGIGGGICEDEDLVVAVVGVADSGEDDTAGADPGEDQGGDVPLAELLVEVGGGERADAGLADDEVSRFGCDVFVDGACGRVAVQCRACRREDGGHPAVGWDGLVVGVLESHTDVADLAAVTADPADPTAPPLALTPLTAAGGSHDAFRPDIAFACYETDADNVQAAIRLRRILPDAVPVVACATGLAGTSLIAMLDRSASGYLANVHGFGLLDRICRPGVILNLDGEILARAAHRDYVRRRLAQGADLANDPALSAWDDLPESLRESNRAQVADIPAKLSAVGYELAPTEDWDSDLFSFPPEQIETLARMEHKRFVEERLRAGYRYGPKDTAAKLSPYLVPWEQLPEDIRDLDRDAVRLIPSLLAAAGYAIVSRRRESRPSAAGVTDGARPLDVPRSAG